jgi:hypothetical protein
MGVSLLYPPTGTEADMQRTFLRRLVALAVITAGALTIVATPASAASLTAVGWSVSKPHPGDTAVRYTWNFTTATTGSIKSVTFSVPTGTAGAALSVVDAYGVGAGTASLTGTTVTYTLTNDVSVSAGVSVLISIDGFTNTSTPGSYASTITTRDNTATTIDTAGSNTVAINNNTTQVLVQVARSTGFTLDTTAFNLLMDPTVPALADRSKAVSLTVATNASQGYTLTTKIDRQLTGTAHGTDVISAISAGKATGVATGSFSANRFGYNVTVGGGGVGTVQGAGFASTGFVGYTTGGEVVVASTAPTNGDTVTITNRAKVDYQQPADTYTATVTYTITPSY